jgi:SAM-dependent methyltransferase
MMTTTGDDDDNDKSVSIVVMDSTSMIGNDLPLTTLSAAMDLLQRQQQQQQSPLLVLVHSTKLASLARRLFHARHIHRLPENNDAAKKQRSNQPFLAAGVGVDEYRSTISTVVQPGDTVLEIGCHGGYSTTLLHEAAAPGGGYCIGVDIGRKIVQRAKEAYPNIPFAVADGFNMLELLKLKKRMVKEYGIFQDVDAEDELGYDVVYVDVGGLSGADGILETLALVDTISQSLQPRAIVVKSLCLQRLSGQLQSFSELWNQRLPNSASKG